MAQESVHCSSPRDCHHLIVVCGHAIWLGGPSLGKDESEWALEPFQAGEAPTFLAHIEAGMNAYRSDPLAMLVFSGGATKRHLTQQTEGGSYRDLALALNPRISSSCILAEPRATDSFQNILLSLLLFIQWAGRPPTRLTIVSHDFKRIRFLNHHIPTLHFPIQRTEFIGIDPPTMRDVKGRELIDKGEAKAIQSWMEDPWGWGEDLRGKRLKRGWTEPEDWDLDMPEGWKDMWRTIAFWDGIGVHKKKVPENLPWLRLDEESRT